MEENRMRKAGLQRRGEVIGQLSLRKIIERKRGKIKKKEKYVIWKM